MNKLIIPTLALALLGMSSCKKRFPCIVAKKSTTETTRSVSQFSKIDLRIAADVYFTQDETLTSDQVTLVASENLFDHIETNIEGNTLVIESKRCIKGNGSIKLYIKSDDLAGISISGSGDVFCQTPIVSPKMDLSISGSGNIEMDLTATNVEADISGSGNMDIAGTTSDLDISISGSGEVNAYTFEVETADVSISGSGNAMLNVSKQLDVSISGSGDVHYLGNPSIYQSITGSGNLHNEN